MSQLNPQQQAAVKMIDHPLLVLAGAGSGKTRVITEKIAYLVKQGVPARNIAAVTFTNKAAREMKSRVSRLLDDRQSRGLRISTFHALGLDILRAEYKTLSYKSGLTLFDEQDKHTLLRNLISHGTKDCDIDNLDGYARQIGQWKNAFVTPEQSLALAAAEQYPAAHLYADYTRSLKAYNAVDFDDLILLPVLLFQQHPPILEKWQNKIRYLLVDEYQDTNITQYQLIRLIAGSLGRFTVVGDDDQSIYAWRGAQPENLAQLQKDYPRLQVIKLEQNYRSTGRILKAANRLIANNPHAFEKRLWSELGYGDALRVLSHKDDLIEAQQIVSEIIHHKFKTGSNYQDYAILYRGNHQSRLFEKGLRENNIPYFISGSTSFFAYSEIKDILGYLRLFVNQDDDAAFLRIINTPKREIGPRTLEKLGAYANERHISLFAASTELGLSQKLSEKSIQRLRKFSNWIVDTADRIERGDTFGVIEQVIDQIDYQQWLRENSKTRESAERKMKNVVELIDWLKRIAAKDTNGEKPLAEIVAKIMLMDVLERSRQEEASDQVSLMTLHAAKGLEFPHVFLIGMEENLLPHQNSIETGNIEEERRLAYVGITRAQRTCTFSYCTHRKRYGEVSECEPSRFLNELPADDLEWVNKKQLDPEVKKERGKASLASLRTMLS
ncbi:DNA helicase and single-stranded DNA-dependent ATPase [Candidatus Methylobacter favarea]|uniref:ATP-dependent DNA helicase Rep n=1 Tax=Candidatus Methylobacter favarea TaxID=2707345 RepID=A0A8S0WBK3_9GAMM|nr:DNA helicase Rep [Candidatus Methylobacter favarea]CAA9891753.1 DNA helicase and single-stranded DNA-dependent ATPase [Candidatus Methylobacter favarea]